jgi:hypothetical protein
MANGPHRWQISHQRARIHFTRARVVDLEAPGKPVLAWAAEPGFDAAAHMVSGSCIYM